MSILVSAVICTYNRSDLLGGAIESLCHQTLAVDQYEILVVDNASTDQTAALVKEYQTTFDQHCIRYIYESQPGLGRARNRALQEAQGVYIAYIDDDARAAPDWLERALHLLQGPEQPFCVGGVIRPFYTSAKPEWFKDEYESFTWGLQPRRLNPGESFCGSNMTWVRQTLYEKGGFDEQVGVRGEVLSGGEETAVFNRLWQGTDPPALIYDPDLVVYHWAPPDKMQVKYVLRRAWAVGQSRWEMSRDRSTAQRARLLFVSSAAFVLWSLRALARRFRYPYWQNWVIEEYQPVVVRLGIMSAGLGLRIAVRR